MLKSRAEQLALFVRDDLNTQEEIDYVLHALLLKTCKNGYSETERCKECPWNWCGLCRQINNYVKMREESAVN